MGFLGEVKEGASDVRVMGDKMSIEVSESQEGADVFDCRGDRPICDSGYLDWVHGQGSGFDYHSKVFDLRDVEGTFF